MPLNAMLTFKHWLLFHGLYYRDFHAVIEQIVSSTQWTQAHSVHCQNHCAIG
jgi:hypothetical protein